MVNLGKNKTAEAIPDYTYGVKKFKDVADMMVRERAVERGVEREGERRRETQTCVADGWMHGNMWVHVSRQMKSCVHLSARDRSRSARAHTHTHTTCTHTPHTPHARTHTHRL